MPEGLVVVLGSTRRPKVQALENVFEALRSDLGAAIELRCLEVPSGVRETPLERTEIMAGARNRVLALQREVPDASYWIGLEGGLHAERSREGGPWNAWLENWAYVASSTQGYFGSGGSIPVPHTLAQEVAGAGRSLAVVIDEMSGKTDVRSGEGTWGILTNGRVTRVEVFRRALLNAFAPFYSRTLKYS